MTKPNAQDVGKGWSWKVEQAAAAGRAECTEHGGGSATSAVGKSHALEAEDGGTDEVLETDRCQRVDYRRHRTERQQCSHMQRLNSVTWSATMNTDAKLYVCIDVICVVLKLERKLPSIDDRGQCSALTYDHMTCDLNIQSPGSCDHGTPPIHKQDIDVKRYIGDCRVELAGREDR